MAGAGRSSSRATAARSGIASTASAVWPRARRSPPRACPAPAAHRRGGCANQHRSRWRRGHPRRPVQRRSQAGRPGGEPTHQPRRKPCRPRHRQCWGPRMKPPRPRPEQPRSWPCRRAQPRSRRSDLNVQAAPGAGPRPAAWPALGRLSRGPRRLRAESPRPRGRVRPERPRLGRRSARTRTRRAACPAAGPGPWKARADRPRGGCSRHGRPALPGSARAGTARHTRSAAARSSSAARVTLTESGRLMSGR